MLLCFTCLWKSFIPNILLILITFYLWKILSLTSKTLWIKFVAIVIIFLLGCLEWKFSNLPDAISFWYQFTLMAFSFLYIIVTTYGILLSFSISIVNWICLWKSLRIFKVLFLIYPNISYTCLVNNIFGSVFKLLIVTFKSSSITISAITGQAEDPIGMAFACSNNLSSYFKYLDSLIQYLRSSINKFFGIWVYSLSFTDLSSIILILPTWRRHLEKVIRRQKKLLLHLKLNSVLLKWSSYNDYSFDLQISCCSLFPYVLTTSSPSAMYFNGGKDFLVFGNACLGHKESSQCIMF